MNNDKIFVVAVVGPTASGKTSLAIRLSKALGGEIVSADSMQIYKGMDIATAMPNEKERTGARHHLIDFLEASESFSVAKYTALASEAIADIASRGKLPIVCGGTGLYIDSLLKNIELLPEAADAQVRERLTREAESAGIERLFERLRRIDPQAAERLHINDRKRIIRALELYELTGVTISEQQARSGLNPAAYEVCYIGITARNRQFLYDRIDRRVDMMLELGLVEEAKRFFALTDRATAAQAIGYKELKPFLDGECTLNEAADRLKMQTRRYAKRQLTWFRKNEEINWLYADEMSEDELFELANKAVCDMRNSLCL